MNLLFSINYLTSMIFSYFSWLLLFLITLLIYAWGGTRLLPPHNNCVHLFIEQSPLNNTINW